MCRAVSSMPTEYQTRELQLQARIRRRIDEGRLPVHLADSISAGYGSGSKCHACDEPIAPSEIEYDLQDPRDGTARLSLHLGCYVIWQSECVKRTHTPPQDMAVSLFC
jgi:hypothetical protein